MLWTYHNNGISQSRRNRLLKRRKRPKKLRNYFSVMFGEIFMCQNKLIASGSTYPSIPDPSVANKTTQSISVTWTIEGVADTITIAAKHPNGTISTRISGVRQISETFDELVPGEGMFFQQYTYYILSQRSTS